MWYDFQSPVERKNICETTKVGVVKTVQGSPEGSWFVDAAEHIASLATKARQAEQEMAVILSTAIQSLKTTFRPVEGSDQCWQQPAKAISAFTSQYRGFVQRDWY